MDRCKHCGEEVPVREVIREVAKTVEVGENAFWLRFWKIFFLFLVALIAVIIAGVDYHSHVEARQLELLLKDPAIKVEIQEIPNSAPLRKFTREGAK